MRRIDWSDDNPNWGNPATCVHESSTGSWLTSTHGQEQDQ